MDMSLVHYSPCGCKESDATERLTLLSIYNTMPVFRRESSCGFSNSAFSRQLHADHLGMHIKNQ